MDAPDDESRWIERSLERDPEAFAELVRRYQRMIHTLAYRLTGSLADAEDLTQETFVRAYRHLAGFRRTAKFSSWLYRIALNLALDWRSTRNRRQQVEEQWSRETSSSDPAAEPDDLSARVQQALMKLPEPQRAAIVLTVYDRLSHAEAAGLLACSEATVSWRVFAARRRLAKLLALPASL
jgi:RNA polymerase sigma-70 factor (ECF subfamily)